MADSSPASPKAYVRGHSSRTVTEAELIRTLLQRDGIGAEVRGEASLGLGFAQYDVWVEARNEARALEAIRTLTEANQQEIRCSYCSELCPSNFERCWKCGATIPLEGNQA
jgi:hypothetical protein